MVVRRISIDAREAVNQEIVFSVPWDDGFRTLEGIEWSREHGFIVRLSNTHVTTKGETPT
jgi:hypothetical protein